MPQILSLTIVLVVLVFFLYVLNKVRNRKLNIKNAFIWIMLSVGIIVCVMIIPQLTVIAHMIGIETVSNMLFYLGFVFIIFVCFNITQAISEQNDKIIRLTQELAILRKEIEDYKGKEDA